VTKTALTYSTVEAAAASGATVRQLNYWASLGYVRPAREPWGTRTRRWTQREVDAAARFVAVLELVRDGTVLEALAYDDDPVRVVLEAGRFMVSIEVSEQ
jgi:hypothetical protein